MGLFDGYFDPQQFGNGGGLLGRLLALQQSQGLYQPGANLDQLPSAPPVPQLQSQPTSWPILPSHGPTSSSSQTAAPNPALQYHALRPILGDRNAMLATVHPDIGKTLIAQALANQQPGNTENVVSASDKQPIASDAMPDPVRPGSQYAQTPFALCFGGPAPCTLGAGLTAGQILGGAALGGGLGALILKNREKLPAPANKSASAPTGKTGNEIRVVPRTDQAADDSALVERQDKKNRCHDRWESEYYSCTRFSRPYTSRFKEACEARANDRLHLCYQNEGIPDPDEPEEYSWKDIARDRQRQ
jgi:hypothetical protein